MKLFIKEIVLWPEDSRNSVLSIPFATNKINVIHGRSRTGKSSIIAIVDYCLGATRCAIPVGIIRDNVRWFGLVLEINDEEVLIARRTPGDRQTSKEFFIDPNFDTIPLSLDTTHNELQFKQAFNNLVQLTNLPLTDGQDIGRFDGRPSYRDLAAFNFLPQHIVANPNTLFFKADSYEHKERLKRVMPFALGVIDNEYLLKEREKSQLQRMYDDLVKQREVLLRSMKAWDADIKRHWDDAVELGLAAESDAKTTETRIEKFGELNRLFLQDGLKSVLQTPNFVYTNERYKDAMKKEIDLQKLVDSHRREVRGLEQLSSRADSFKNAVKLEQNRVVNFDWLKSRIGGDNECVVCGSHTNQLSDVISHLDTEVNRVNVLAKALFENPVVDKEIEASKSRLRQASAELHTTRVERNRLQTIDAATKDSLSRVYLLIGRIQSALAAVATSNNTDDLSNRIDVLSKQLNDLNSYFLTSGKSQREAKVDSHLSGLIDIYAEGFGLEKRGSIKLDKNELTLSFRFDENSKKEYLWEVGSGANWMGYHIATFLALHEFFSSDELKNTPVFQFLIIDQPSQVYFPSAASGANDLDKAGDEIKNIIANRNEDIEATKKIFEMLAEGLRRSSNRYQIIVLEHADASIWGHCKDTVEAANWKSADGGLIPHDWILSKVMR
ncbi:DUF3732 domain-containing protein [Pseudoduganella namucuonensis]|uniref:DUF3732 domain-containing protein n=1 Tax=Pseudoduganella namucuonensis TaxID=1035707 RepID=A0A1I7M5K7_9BURK|nr:DUF3732 domain-containing protein [Pseudoduganella namucuonensis]SFV17176.1 Protein of unknown function [Pseudoduganella namucuonensis]